MIIKIGLIQLHYQWCWVGNSIEFPTLRIASLRKFYKIKNRFLGVLLFLITVITLTGCKAPELTAKSAEVPQLVQHIVGEPKTFNYALSNELPNVFGLIYIGLISENGITGKLEPDLAESWEISADKKQIIFTLRDGLKWSDGENLTADDVVFTFNDIYFNKSIPTATRDVLLIGKNQALPQVEKLDNRHIKFTVPEPFAPFLRTAGQAAILPKHSLEKLVITKNQNGKPQFLSSWGTDTDPKKIISNGPYKLDNYRTTERLVFLRNPYYWRRDSEGNPQPYIQRIIWQIVENTDTALLQFRSGGLDILGISPTSFALLKKEEKRGKFTIYNGGSMMGTTFITFNLNQGKRNGHPLVNPIKSKWFNNLAFRQAIAYGIDRRTMINNIYRGLGKPQYSPISVQSPYYISPQEGLKNYDYNPEKSKELLKAAGFRYNQEDELLDAEGNQVRFTLAVGAGGKDFVQAQIKRDLSKLGIQVDIQTIAFSVLLDKLNNALDWECSLLGFTGGIEPNEGANLWLPEGEAHLFNQKPQAAQPQIEGRQVADWEQKIGQLYIQGARELDDVKRKEIYAETQRITQENLPFIYLVNPLNLAAVRDRIKGVKYSALGGLTWNIYEWRIER